jgi:serine/threonine-protein kinase
MLRGSMTLEDELVTCARSRVGRVLREKYQLVSLLGVGGWAAVYAAVHLRNANRVAVKVLHPQASLEPSLRERFLREGYAANIVDHPGTVRVLDDDVAEDGCVFLVMELLEGETLEARIERCTRLSVPEVVGITRSLLAVLHAAHQKGIVHRDVKPENLFLTYDGKLKLLDFGVARMATASVHRTRSGAIFGTPSYMPPEQALGRTREMDALTDVWAVGATAFRLLSGRFVHEGESGQEMMIRTATSPAPRLASVAPHVPERVARIVDRALEYDRRDRWPSALAMMSALEAVEEDLVASDYPEAFDPSHASPVATTTPTVPLASTVGGVATHGARASVGWRGRPAVVVALAAPLATALAGLALLLALRAPQKGALAVAPAGASSAQVVPPAVVPSREPRAAVDTPPAPPSAAPSTTAAEAETPVESAPVVVAPAPASVHRSPVPAPIASSSPRKRDPLAP